MKSSLTSDLPNNFLVTASQWEQENVMEHIWQQDPNVWKRDPDHQKIISNALGWLSVTHKVASDIERLQKFTYQLVDEGFDTAVVLGMGGSSLVSYVLQQAFAPHRTALTLEVLDSTHPDAVKSLDASLDLKHTLFIVASKSGSTTEPNAFYHYFYHRAQEQNLDPSHHFVAITDPNTSMHKEAQDKNFREIFLNPADIGGRYSALSWFGMVPASLMGLDVSRILLQANSMEEASRNNAISQNPAASLGLWIGLWGAQGRDKVTLILPEMYASLADWIEQLIAESTGKEGLGLLPIAHEPPLPIEKYTNDRVFVVYHASSDDTSNAEFVAALRKNGHPVIEYSLDNSYDIGREFFRWEFAIAIAGKVLNINPFDQPNVQESKDNTKDLLQTYHTTGNLPSLSMQEFRSLKFAMHGLPDASSLPQALGYLLSAFTRGDYLAIMAYVYPTSFTWTALQNIRKYLARVHYIPSTLGYGPRFLHSTGQLHKGGANNGLFLQIIQESEQRLSIPGDGYDFETLLMAQAIGDFRSLDAHKRRVIQIIIPPDILVNDALDELESIVQQIPQVK